MTVTVTRDVDADFLALPLKAVADAALSAARAAGAEHADVRVHRLLTQSIRLRDGKVQSVSDSDEVGVAVRVIVDGTWGLPPTRRCHPLLRRRWHGKPSRWRGRCDHSIAIR